MRGGRAPAAEGSARLCQPIPANLPFPSKLLSAPQSLPFNARSNSLELGGEGWRPDPTGGLQELEKGTTSRISGEAALPSHSKGGRT